MRKLFEFIRSVYVVVLFVALEVAAISYYAHSTHYTQARLLARSNQVAGGVHGFFAGIRRYFTLGRENRLLLGRVAQLEERLAQYEEAETNARLDSYMQDIGESKYRFATASVVANTVNRAQNLITLNRGRQDGVVEEMAVLSPDGAMAGYVVDCGELSKYADPKPGQEVVTTGFSQYFPADVLIGWVESASLNETRTAYTVRVRLAAEMSRLNEVVLVGNRDFYEIRNLQQSEQIEQHTRPD